LDFGETSGRQFFQKPSLSDVRPRYNVSYGSFATGLSQQQVGQCPLCRPEREPQAAVKDCSNPLAPETSGPQETSLTRPGQATTCARVSVNDFTRAVPPFAELPPTTIPTLTFGKWQYGDRRTARTMRRHPRPCAETCGGEVSRRSLQMRAVLCRRDAIRPDALQEQTIAVLWRGEGTNGTFPGLSHPPSVELVWKFAGTRSHEANKSDHLPLVSTLCFSSSFIFLMTGSRLASPVVWVVVAGGLAFGSEDCPGGVVAGRVAVALGGELVCETAVCACKRRALASSNAASAVGPDVIDRTP
jgi:hypothetical protein